MSDYAPRRFDIVQIKTTKNINFVSGLKGKIPSPHGNWSIVGFIGTDAIISRDSTTVRVPIQDVRIIAKLNTESLIRELGDKRGKKGKENKRKNYYKSS